MAYIIQIADVYKHIYQETVDEITRGDNTIIQYALDTAIAEAAGYLNNKYDVDKLLGTSGTNATVTDVNLKSKLLDLVRWHICGLGNANIEYDAAHNRYMMAIEKYFEKVQQGKLAPLNWPFRDTTLDAAPPEGDAIHHSSNTKRNNHFN